MPRTGRTEAMKTGQKAANVRHVNCQVEPGMFDGELLVSIQGINPQNPKGPFRVQLLADSALVTCGTKPERGRPVEGRLRVGVVRIKEGIATVVLPQPAIPVGEAMLVREDQLTD